MKMSLTSKLVVGSITAVAVVFCIATSSLAQPVVPGYTVESYASLEPDIITLSFAPNGTLFVARDLYPERPLAAFRIAPGGPTDPLDPYDPAITAHGDPLIDGAALIYDPYGHNWDGHSFDEGTVLVGGGPFHPGRIWAIAPDEHTEVVFESYDFRNPIDMVFDSTGRLLFTDENKNIYQSSGAHPTVLFSTPAVPYNIAVDVTDYIYVSSGDNTIRIYDSDGTLINAAFASGLTQAAMIPLAFGPGGIWGTDLYVIGANTLRRYYQNGTYDIVGTGFDGTYMDMAFGPDGNLYIVDFVRDAISKIMRIVPQSLVVDVDIKPGSCPNPVNLNKARVVPVVVLGTEDFDVTTVNPATTRLSRDGVEGYEVPLRWALGDVATPFEGELCDCHDLNGDGYLDLKLKFHRKNLVMTLKLSQVLGQTVPLTLTGNLKEEFGGTQITGEDCLKVRPRVKGKARLVPIETSGVYGKARLVSRANGKTRIVLRGFTGLTPGETYAAHIRDGGCDEAILFTLNDVIVDDQGVARSVTVLNASIDFDAWWIEVGGVTCGKVKL